MELGQGLNRAAWRIAEQCIDSCELLGISSFRTSGGARVLDFGVETRSGLEAGLQLASICMAGRARIDIVRGDRTVWAGPWVQVTTNHPIEACMLSQYAGWPVQFDDFFAMGSGAMRVQRGREELLKALGAVDSDRIAVGSLECNVLPSAEVLSGIAEACGVSEEALCVAVAPTRSLAGCIQVVARSVETSLHKLFELGFPLSAVRSAYGIAPLPPPTPDMALGIGRTNDAILYGGHVSLWMESDDEQIVETCSKLPSSVSRDFGAPFVEIFQRYGNDFYKVDPGLFSPAEVLVQNMRSGNSWHFGELREDLVAKSFATELT